MSTPHTGSRGDQPQARSDGAAGSDRAVGPNRAAGSDGTAESDRAAGSIRAARAGDVPSILGLIHDLATYERAPDAVEATEDLLREALFPQGHAPTAFAHVAVVDETVVGMAIWFVTFSTWLGRSGIWLEDLFVQPEHRGSGLGKALLATLAALCAERGYGRLEWWVLKWNTPSIDFYDSLQGQPMDDWLTYRLDSTALEALAQSELG